MINIKITSPANGEKNCDLSSYIEFDITNSDSAIADIDKLNVSISGELAINSGSFTNNYSGEYSEIVKSDTGYSVLIHPKNLFKINKQISLKITIVDQNNKNYFLNSVFFTKKSPPFIEEQTISQNTTIKQDQVHYFKITSNFSNLSLSTLNIKINDVFCVEEGSINSSLYAGQSSVANYDSYLEVFLDKITPLRNGNYLLFITCKNEDGEVLSKNINFSVDKKVSLLPPAFPQVKFDSFYQGIKKISDVGDGSSFDLSWPKILKRIHQTDCYALIYSSLDKNTTFDSPSFICLEDTVETRVSDFSPGKTYHFAVRGLESYKDVFDFSNLTQSYTDTYKLPDSTSISKLLLSDDDKVFVSSVEGFPQKGLLVIERAEVIKYSGISKEDNCFIIAKNGRGLNGTKASTHTFGDSVSLFLKCVDANQTIAKGTPTFSKENPSGREVNSVGILVNDYQDEYKKAFEGFDFCGYHQAIPHHTLQGIDDCGSYLGGEFAGGRGFDIYSRMLNREELLLYQVGEPVVLLQRIWSGEKCRCVTLRREHQKQKTCKYCFGTGYNNGFVQYTNNRRGDGLTYVSFGDTQEDLELKSQAGLENKYEASCWTLPVPIIRDRDLIIRFDYDGDIEYIYEILNTTKEKLFFRHYGRQRLQIKRLDKTDIVYSFPFTLPTEGFTRSI